MSDNPATEAPEEITYRGTYDPEDNKLRLRASAYLPKEIYDKVSAQGFRWASKQNLFVAPMWTPSREAFLIKMAGTIEDEDTSLADRAEQRAERFTGYKENRERDAENAKQEAEYLAGGSVDQPIILGRQNARQAEKLEQKIKNKMAHSVKMWETSEYWVSRAKGCISSANYKAQPEVRARRIKKIEAHKRKEERQQAKHKNALALWDKKLTPRIALAITGVYEFRVSMCFPLDKYPRSKDKNQSQESMDLYYALRDEIISPEQARDLSKPAHNRSIARAQRWIDHYNHRLLYEKTLLDASSYVAPVKVKSKKQTLPLLNYKTKSITSPSRFHAGQFDTYKQYEMSKALYRKIPTDCKWTVIVENSHKARICQAYYVENNQEKTRWGTVAIFLTDSKVHKKPEPIQDEPPTPTPPRPEPLANRGYTPKPETEYDRMKETLKNGGVKVEVADQLFPTPKTIAEKVIEYADIEEGHTVLEPSAGAGSLLDAITTTGTQAKLTAVEINFHLCNRLKERFEDVRYADFLSLNGDLGQFDRVVMNPPFKNGEDIKHINHALDHLKPGGRLVAICANGPRQQKAFMDQAEYWEDLPEGSFKNQGTNINTALMVLVK